MPQTTLVASSCAMTLPPALTTSAAPVGAVGAHAGQDQRQIPGAPDLGGGRKQRIDRGLAVMHRRAVVEHDHRGAVAARDLHVPAAGREIDVPGQHRLAVDRLAHRLGAGAGQMLGEDGGEGRAACAA